MFSVWFVVRNSDIAQSIARQTVDQFYGEKLHKGKTVNFGSLAFYILVIIIYSRHTT